MRIISVTAIVLLWSISAAAGPPTVSEARDFIERAEKERRELLAKRERADWVRSTWITLDTEAIQAAAEVDLMAHSARIAREATRYMGLPLTAAEKRKLTMMRTAQTLPAPDDDASRKALAGLSTSLASAYGKGRYCATKGTCLNLGELSHILATTRNPEAAKEAWEGWRTVSVPMRDDYRKLVALANAGAKQLGFPDLGALWRSKYDMPPDAFAAEVDRLFAQVRPLYEQLHCYTRARLSEHYGPEVVSPQGPIPAHLLGNMWAQDWANLAWLLVPGGQATAEAPLTAALKRAGTDERELVRFAERFFTSLGFPELPETFWERSMFTRPPDREVECHASAWPVDWARDVRIKMCIEVGEEDFITAHHELGHIYYYLAYADLDTLYTEGAHDGFHEAVGDVLALSVTPAYLQKVGLEIPPSDPIPQLMRRALERVVFLPFGLLVDKWRWQVFSGKTPPERYNQAWWDLRQQYQGVAPPSPRGEEHFDPGAKYHIPSSVPYMRYFLAHVLQFQLHRALCQAAGHQGPLHECSIYGSQAAGEKLWALLKLGASKPWPDALEAVTGQREMDATALLDYFAPLHDWLKEQNQGRQCGWAP